MIKRKTIEKCDVPGISFLQKSGEYATARLRATFFTGEGVSYE